MKLLKFFIMLLCVIVLDILLIVSCARTSHAESFYNNGVSFKPQYINQNGRILIQLRDVSKQLGYSVMWFENTGTVYIGKKEGFAMFGIESKMVYVYGFEIF